MDFFLRLFLPRSELSYTNSKIAIEFYFLLRSLAFLSLVTHTSDRNNWPIVYDVCATSLFLSSEAIKSLLTYSWSQSLHLFSFSFSLLLSLLSLSLSLSVRFFFFCQLFCLSSFIGSYCFLFLVIKIYPVPNPILVSKLSLVSNIFYYLSVKNPHICTLYPFIFKGILHDLTNFYIYFFSFNFLFSFIFLILFLSLSTFFISLLN